MSAVTEDELKSHQKNIGGKRVTLDALKSNIKSEDYYIHPGSQLTICILTLMNGFTVTGESACADPSMFDEEIGRRIAKEKAQEKIWPLMGYALKQEIYLTQGEEGTFKGRVLREQTELSDRINKLHAFIYGSENFSRLSEARKKDLRQQLDAMGVYHGILVRRWVAMTNEDEFGTPY